MRMWLGVLALAILAATVGAANATAISTPSGTIHVTYVDNNTFMVIKYNNKVLTVNLKANVTEGYYIHLVGHVVGIYGNTTAGHIAALLSQIKNATSQTEVLNTLKNLAAYLINTNETRKIEARLVAVARTTNATTNATWLKVKIEYEFKRQAKALNQTVVTPERELEIKGWAGNWTQVVAVLEKIVATTPLDTKTAAALRHLIDNVRNVTETVYKLKTVVNGTEIVFKLKNGKFEIKIENKVKNGKGHEKKDGDEKAKDGKAEDGKKGDKSKEQTGEKSDKEDREKHKSKGEKKEGREPGKDR